MEPSTIIVTVVAAVVVMAMAVVVARLRRQVRSLHDHVARLARSVDDAREGPRVPQPASSWTKASPADEGQQSTPHATPEAVAVITGFDSDGPEATEQVRTTRVVSATLGEPLIKAASMAHGVRRALDDEGRIRIKAAARKELRHQRKARRRARRRAVPKPPAGGHGPSSAWTGGRSA